MAWTDNIVTDYKILTGDGKEYTPISSYLTWNKRYEFNISELVFKDVEGTLVKRGTAKGNQYNIEVIFQGADHLEDAKRFEVSSKSGKDKSGYYKPWTLTHPFYGNLNVQPVWLAFGNGELNLTRITGVVIQTIQDNGIAVQNNAPDVIAAAVTKTNETFSITISADVPEMNASFLARLRQNVDRIYRVTIGAMNKGQSGIDKYTGYYNDVNSLINTITHDTLEVMGATQTMLTEPAYFVDSVKSRLGMFQAALAIINQDIDIILSAYNIRTRDKKKQFECNAAANIAGMCLASVTNVTDDYAYRPAVISTISTLITSYNEYVANLCRIQSPYGGLPDSYIPDADSVILLKQLVDYTTGNLFNIAGTALQQRIYTVPYDTNILVLADELYGIDEDNTAVDQLIANNDIGISEILFVPKGREIVYYV